MSIRSRPSRPERCSLRTTTGGRATSAPCPRRPGGGLIHGPRQRTIPRDLGDASPDAAKVDCTLGALKEAWSSVALV